MRKLRALTRSQTVTVIVGTGLMVFSVILALWRPSVSGYAPIAQPQTQSDMARMIARLSCIDANGSGECEEVDFRIVDDNILVVPEMQMSMAAEKLGLPQVTQQSDSQRTSMRFIGLFIIGFIVGLILLLWVIVDVLDLFRWQTPSQQGKIDDFEKSMDEHEPLEQNTAFDPRLIAGVLKREHPQTIAAYLMSIESENAAAVLEKLPESFQETVWLRMAMLGDVDDAVLRMVVETVEQSAQHDDVRQQNHHAMHKAEEILRRLPVTKRAMLLQQLVISDRKISAQLLPYVLKFEDIAMLDDRTLERLFHYCDVEKAVVLFRKYPHSFPDAFLNRVIVLDLPAVSVSGMETYDVQQTMMEHVRKLAMEGRLHFAVE